LLSSKFCSQLKDFKLDDVRIGKLLEIIRTGLGQLFITDARPDRTFELLSRIGVRANVYDVEAGMIRNVKSSNIMEDRGL
jgi:hypothetical protein